MLGMDAETPVIGHGIRRCKRYRGLNGAWKVQSVKAPPNEPEVQIPQALRMRLKDFQQAVPVIFIECSALIRRVKRTNCAHHPVGGIIHKHILDGPGRAVDNRNLKHLYALRAKYVAAVSVSLLLVVLTCLQKHRNPVRGQG